MIHERIPRRTQISRDIEAHWSSLQRDGKLPSFDSFDPLDIPDLIPNLIVIEVTTEPTQRLMIKMSGSAVRERTGYDVTGSDFRDLYDPSSRDAVWSAVSVFMTFPCGLVQYNEALYKDAYDAITEGTVFPLSGSTPDTNYIVGVTQWIGYSNKDSTQHPVVINRSDRFEWIDIGFGTPGK